MQRDGWTGPLVNIDYSEVVVDQMKKKYDEAYYESWNSNSGGRRGGGHHGTSSFAGASGSASCPPPPPTPMEFICADITERLPFADCSFDLVVCKGSFDAVLCGSNSRYAVGRVVKEIVRLLAPGFGVFFLVTHGNPDSRIEYLEHENSLNHYWFGVSVHSVARPMHHQNSNSNGGGGGGSR